jgi:hypothetical protein
MRRRFRSSLDLMYSMITVVIEPIKTPARAKMP